MKPKTILKTLIAAALLIAPIHYYTREKLPEACLHKFGKWSEAKTEGIWPMQFHYCEKCHVAERRKI